MQNLVRHLKFVAKEAHEVAYDDQKMLSSQSSKSELERYALHVVFLPSKGSNTHSSDPACFLGTVAWSWASLVV